MLKCWSIGKFTEDTRAKALEACNAMNSKFRWVKFYAGKDMEITVQLDAILNEETCGKEVMELVLRMVGIVDKAYPEFMKARWA